MNSIKNNANITSLNFTLNIIESPAKQGELSILKNPQNSNPFMKLSTFKISYNQKLGSIGATEICNILMGHNKLALLGT